MAWQFHRLDLGEGLVQAFRRPDSPNEGAVYPLQGLKAEAEYSVVNLDDAKAQRTTGRDLLTHGLTIRLPSRPAAALFVYKEIRQQGEEHAK